MAHYKLKSAHFINLKGLKNVTLNFEKPLTAIMGVNGSGKTTVIHALACAYQSPKVEEVKKVKKGKKEDKKYIENYRFPDFFIPNTDSLWQGSEFDIVHERIEKTPPSNTEKSTVFMKKYRKSVDRWKPRYCDRPLRNVYYIGIDTCLPEVEKSKTPNRITYTSSIKVDDLSKKIIRYAAEILNKDYKFLLDNTYKNKNFYGVTLESGLKYSSLSMGTGEQRTIKILEKVITAEKYSLILIDEIDLLLHPYALKNLITKLYEIANNKDLQIIFTTHSLEMTNLNNFVGIQYLHTIRTPKDQAFIEQTFVYKRLNSDLIFSLSGSNTNPLKIYVEDKLAETTVRKVLRRLNLTPKANIIKFGSIENAFTIAAANVLSEEDCKNILVLLDGDRYQKKDEKLKHIRNRLSGTEADIEKKCDKAVSIIMDFQLPPGKSPEKFFHELLIKYGDPDNELVIAASGIKGVSNTHKWLYGIREKLNDDESNIVRDIIDIAWDSEEFQNYIKPVCEWLKARKNE